MNLVSVIGTRPQYIKIKPFYDYCLQNKINHSIIDTNQHYSSNVSDIFISEFDLKIDYKLQAENSCPNYFISDSIKKIHDIFKDICPTHVLVYGDTNSTLSAAISTKNLGIPLYHVEAGIRCNDTNRPEEINRILIDDLSDVHFISRHKDFSNVNHPVYIGDLEYYFLNSIEKSGKMTNIEYLDFYLMTIHRKENSNVDNIKNILNMCESLKDKIIWPIHHRIKKIISNMDIPKNIHIIEPLGYMDMIYKLCKCKGIISDSGGVTKTSPFFGKKCIIPLKTNEWDDVVEHGYATLDLNKDWFKNYKIQRNTNIYYEKNCCDIIRDNLK